MTRPFLLAACQNSALSQHSGRIRRGLVATREGLERWTSTTASTTASTVLLLNEHPATCHGDLQARSHRAWMILMLTSTIVAKIAVQTDITHAGHAIPAASGQNHADTQHLKGTKANAIHFDFRGIIVDRATK